MFVPSVSAAKPFFRDATGHFVNVMNPRIGFLPPKTKDVADAEAIVFYIGGNTQTKNSAEKESSSVEMNAQLDLRLPWEHIFS